MESKIYNQKGEEAGKIILPEELFGLPLNNDLIHQVVVSMQSNSRVAIADTKDRAEVSGSGIKPYRQKGTGRARQGSKRSPLWRTGGVTHGPLSVKNFNKKINKKTKKKAFFVALSQKMRDKEILFLDSLSLDKPKTKEASFVIKSLSKIEGFGKLATKKKNTAIFALSEKNKETARSFSNIQGMEVYESRNLNLLDLLAYKYIVISNPKESFEIMK